MVTRLGFIIQQDKNTMAHFLEVKFPFLDDNLIALGFKIFQKLKENCFKDKIIQRCLAQRLLPKAVVNRSKKPFYFPIRHFFEYPQFDQMVKLTLNN